jgi:hypothetical protein
MKKFLIPASVILVISFLSLMCAEESNPVINNIPVIDPITRTWVNESDSNHTFHFVTFDSLVTRGIFFGEEDGPDEEFTELCGFFDGVYVEFDVRRPVGNRTKFKGNFTDSNRMELESPEGNIVLIATSIPPG